ncbi:MAG: fibronectin type III domain-containing protein [Chloroflexota bacterium]
MRQRADNQSRRVGAVRDRPHHAGRVAAALAGVLAAVLLALSSAAGPAAPANPAAAPAGGWSLYVPLALRLHLPAPEPTLTVTQAPTGPVATSTPTVTETPTPSETQTPEATATCTETPAPTASDTPTPEPTATATATATAVPTATGTATATPSASPTATATGEPSGPGCCVCANYYCFPAPDAALCDPAPPECLGPVAFTTASCLPPAASTDLVAEALSPVQIELRWTDASSDELGFEVELLGHDGQWAFLALLGPDNQAYLDDTLNASTPYAYRVRALGACGYSEYSNEAEATNRRSPDLRARPNPGTMGAI